MASDKKININNFKLGDIFYIRRNCNGYAIDVKCTFLRIQRGMLVGNIIEVDGVYSKFDYPIGTELKSQKKLCYIRQPRIFCDGSSIPAGCWWLNPKTGDFE